MMPARTPHDPAPGRKRRYRKSGLYALQRALERTGPGDAWLDELGETGAKLREFRDALVADLGGNVTAQQQALVNLTIRTALLLEHVDGYLLRSGAIVNRRSRKLHRVVLDRQRLADSLAKYLQMLGLERRGPEVGDLREYVANVYGEGGSGGPGA
ncbi:MAG: hypothetical protein HY704_02780 [Gemmatimonadetes bacterium]|nr:hypothetical protein [Gemmatimonadota bacterium]